MPVTAKLSKRFYDQFGDETVNELVNLLNVMDTTYRDDLKEINNINFARFDAKLEQRFAEQDAKIEKRFAEQDAKFEKRFAEQDAKFEKRFAEQDAKIEKRFAEQDAKFEKRFAALEITLERALKEHTRWMVGAWLSVMLTIVVLSVRS